MMRRRFVIVRSLLLLSLVIVSPFVFRSSVRSSEAISYADSLRLVDDLLDEALHRSLSVGHKYLDDAPPTSSRHRLSSASSALVSADALRERACRILRGKTIFLVGPRDTLYQLHSFLLNALHDSSDAPKPATTAPTARRPSCSGPSSCPFHTLCHPHPIKSPTPADILATATTTNSSLLRFLHSGNLDPSPSPSPTPTLTPMSVQDDEHLDPRRLSMPVTVPLFVVDPRTGVRVVVDSRWVRQAAAAKAGILVLNRGPLPAPAWSYDHDHNHDASSARNDNLTSWLSTLRVLEREHADVDPRSADLFASVLSRLDHQFPSETDSTDARKLLLGAALHSTVSTFLPSLLSTLRDLREHVGHRAVLGKKPVLWYGSWFLPVTCAPDSLSVFSSENDDPRRLLTRLLAQAEAMDNPWSAYYNAQVYMHDRLLARLLPTYGVLYISSLSTLVPQEVRQGGRDAKDWSCIQRIFETPRGALMGQKFLGDFIDVLDSWN